MFSVIERETDWIVKARLGRGEVSEEIPKEAFEGLYDTEVDQVFAIVKDSLRRRLVEWVIKQGWKARMASKPPEPVEEPKPEPAG